METRTVNHEPARLCENDRVPKVVDHEQRRAELGAAVRRLVARSGVEGATVRAVAREAGWSMGALRYYFGTQDELLDFALEASLADIPVRLARVLGTRQPGLRRAQALVEELLPLDDRRMAEVRVYLAFMARVRTEDRALGVAERLWHGERHVCGLALADVTGEAPPTVVGVVPRHLRARVDELQVFVDGLSFLGATIPGRMTAARATTLVRAELERLSG